MFLFVSDRSDTLLLLTCESSTTDLDPITLEFNAQSNGEQKSMDDEEENCRATESMFRALPELRYRYYVINAACLFLAIQVIQALILEK